MSALLALEDGSLWVESHPDVYRADKQPLKIFDELEIATGYRTLAREAIRKREGIATRIRPGDEGESPGAAATPTPGLPQTADAAAAPRTRRLP